MNGFLASGDVNVGFFKVRLKPVKDSRVDGSLYQVYAVTVACDKQKFNACAILFRVCSTSDSACLSCSRHLNRRIRPLDFVDLADTLINEHVDALSLNSREKRQVFKSHSWRPSILRC